MRRLFILPLGILALCAPFVLHAASWSVTGTTLLSETLHAALPPSGNAFEASDATIVDGRLLLVSDEGDVATMDTDGGNVSQWLTWANNDLEGVTVVGDVLYLLNERYRDVYAYDLATHDLLATYDLSPWISGSDNEGPEGLVYHDGQWLVGHSVTEEVFAFDLSGSTPAFLGSWNSGAHVRAMHSGEDGYLYIMTSGRIAVFDGTTEIAEYDLPAGPSGPEGFALLMDCAAGEASAFIAYDSGPVYRYDGFPVSCAAASLSPSATESTPEPLPVDADGDGALSDADCDDADSAVSTPVTYYRDADQDTLGDVSVSTSVCASVAPSGYVANADDVNDAQAYFSATGTTNGSILVTYGDGSISMYQVFTMTTSIVTTVSVYKDSSYLLVYGPYGKRVAIVDAYTGQVVAMRWVPRSSSALASWISATLGF